MSEINSIANGTYTIGQTSATNFVAGPGIKIDEPSAGTVRIGTDETVLFDGQVTVNIGNTAQLSESIHNFEYIKMIDNSLDAGSTRRLTTIPVVSGTRSIGTNDTWTDVSYNPTYAASKYAGFNFYMIDEGGTIITTNGSYISHMGNTGAPTERNQGNLYKVIGINRISGSNA